MVSMTDPGRTCSTVWSSKWRGTGLLPWPGRSKLFVLDSAPFMGRGALGSAVSCLERNAQICCLSFEVLTGQIEKKLDASIQVGSSAAGDRPTA